MHSASPRPYTVSVICETWWASGPRTYRKGPAMRSNMLPLTLLAMPVERKSIMQISAERPPTTMPREEPTC
ncbi:hypothetical protein Tco_1229750 [Tanacetum coccineum]